MTIPPPSVQATVYATIIPFLPFSSGSAQENVTFLEPILTMEKESGGAVGAINNMKLY